MYVYLFSDRKLPCKDAALILHSLLALCVARFKSCIVVCLVSVGGCNVCAGKAVLLCQSSKKEFYKKFLYEPLPVEVC